MLNLLTVACPVLHSTATPPSPREKTIDYFADTPTGRVMGCDEQCRKRITAPLHGNRAAVGMRARKISTHRTQPAHIGSAAAPQSDGATDPNKKVFLTAAPLAVSLGATISPATMAGQEGVDIRSRKKGAHIKDVPFSFRKNGRLPEHLTGAGVPCSAVHGMYVPWGDGEGKKERVVCV
jgi:hypothetical protein